MRSGGSDAPERAGLVLVSLILVAAGANSATSTLRLKEGATTTPATNVANATFTVTASTDDNTLKFGIVRLTPRLRYLGMTYQAGTNAAIPATTSSTPTTATAVAGSVGLTSYKNEAIVRVRA